MRHLLISDSACDKSGKEKPQHGWIQCITSDDLSRGKTAPVSLISWKSRKMRRKAVSSTLCEAISLSTSLGALEKQVSMLDSMLLSRYNVREQLEQGDDGGLRGEPVVIAEESPLYSDPRSIAVIDSKSLFDGSSNEQPQGDCERTTLEVAVIHDSLARTKGRVRWVPHNRNPADMLTKLKQAHEAPMMELLRTSQFKIEEEADVLATGRQGEHRMKVKYRQQDSWEADKLENSLVRTT